MMAEDAQLDITALTVQLLSAFVANNSVPSEALADLIKSTRAALADDKAPTVPADGSTDHIPAVSVRKSLASPDHILSLIDGKPYKTLKRHLTSNGLTFEEYRDRYNLPKSYPSVAPNFAAERRAVAARIGLGRKKPAKVTEAEGAAPSPQDEPAQAVTTAPNARKPARKKTGPISEGVSLPSAVAKETPLTEAPTTPNDKKPRKRLSISMPQTADVAPIDAADPSPTEVPNPAPTKRPRGPAKTKATAETKQKRTTIPKSEAAAKPRAVKPKPLPVADT